MFPTIDKRRTGVKMRRIMDERGLTVKDVKQYLRLGSVQSVYHWLNGECLPSLDNLYALSQLFQMPMDDMLCGNRRMLTMHIEKPQQKRLYTYYEKINEQYVA